MNFKRFGRTTNLFPDNAVRYEYALGSGARIVSYNGAAMYIIPIANGATYTCKIYTPDVSILVVRLALYDKSSPSVGDVVYGLQEVLNQVEPTLTITNSYNKPYLIVQISGVYVDTYGIDDVMLNLGSEPLPYEPYGNTWHDIPHYIHNTSADTLTTLPAVIYANDNNATVGLKGNMEQSGTPTPQNPIQPQECGDLTGNLFDKTAVVTGNILSDGTIGTNQAFRTSDYILATPNTNYAASYLTIAYRGRAVAFYQSDKTFISALQNNVESDDDTAPFTFVTPDNCYFIRIATYIEHTNHVDELMCNLGSTALPYEPWGIKIPILSNSTTTPVYLGEVQSTRRIKKLVFDGTENISKIGTNAPYAYYVRVLQEPPINRTSFICSHIPAVYVYQGENPAMIISSDLKDFLLNIGKELIESQPSGNTVAGLKEYLATQYAAGTPVTVWYVLATETTGIVNEPLRKIGDYADEVSGISIPTIAGANTLSVDTTLQPSEVTVNYKGWHPVQSVHERENGAWT